MQKGRKIMKYVEIYKLTNTGDQNVILKCFLKDNMVVFEGEHIQLAKNLEDRGISDNEDKTLILYPKDGLRFLENLKYHLTSGYLNASEVKEA